MPVHVLMFIGIPRAEMYQEERRKRYWRISEGRETKSGRSWIYFIVRDRGSF